MRNEGNFSQAEDYYRRGAKIYEESFKALPQEDDKRSNFLDATISAFLCHHALYKYYNDMQSFQKTIECTEKGNRCFSELPPAARQKWDGKIPWVIAGTVKSKPLGGEAQTLSKDQPPPTQDQTAPMPIMKTGDFYCTKSPNIRFVSRGNTGEERTYLFPQRTFTQKFGEAVDVMPWSRGFQGKGKGKELKEKMDEKVLQGNSTKPLLKDVKIAIDAGSLYSLLGDQNSKSFITFWHSKDASPHETSSSSAARKLGGGQPRGKISR